MALVKLHPRMLEVSGALFSASSSQSIPNGDWTSLTWDTERHDLGGWFDVANPERLTVVPGVGFVRVSAGFRWGSNSMAGLIQARIVKNDGTFPGQPQVAQIPSGNDTQFLVSGILAVVPGDYFAAQVRHTSGAAYGFEKAANASWFAIEGLG